MKLQTMVERARNVLLLLACVVPLALAADHFRMRSQDHFLATQTYYDLYYLPPPEYLSACSLGYREALADLVWMKALVYFGQEIVHHGNVSNIYQYTDAMLTLDPYFKKVYRWVASVSLYRTGEVTSKDAYKAIGYLKRGMRLFPDDGDLAWDLGATYSYELAPMLKEQAAREGARREGLTYLELAALRGAGPAWLGLQTAGQLDKLGKTEQAIRHLQDIYATVQDPALKQEIEVRITRLRSASYVEAMRRADAELEASRKKAFPYLDASLFLLVGGRPAFDGTALMARDFDPIATGASERELRPSD